MSILAYRVVMVVFVVFIFMCGPTRATHADDEFSRSWSKYISQTEERLKQKEREADRIRRVSDPSEFRKDSLKSANKIVQEGAKGIKNRLAKNLFKAADNARGQLEEFNKMKIRETEFIDHIDGVQLRELEKEIRALKSDLYLAKQYVAAVQREKLENEIRENSLKSQIRILLGNLVQALKDAERRLEEEKRREEMARRRPPRYPGPRGPGPGVPGPR